MRRRSIAVAGVLAAAAVALGVLVARVDVPAPSAAPGASGAPGSGAVAGSSPGPPAPAPAAPARAPRSDPAASPPPGPIPLDVWIDPATLSPEALEARRRARLEQAQRARAAYEQHPPFSRPLRENEDLLVPEQIAATVRPLAPPTGPSGASSTVTIRQTQDRVFLRPGTVAVVGLEATAGGQRVPVAVRSAVLVRSSGSPPDAVGLGVPVAFADAGPGLAASFAVPADVLGSYTGDLLLHVDAEAGGERGTLVYAFVYTGEPPAAFTGRARDRLERGSVVFEAGIDVRRAGRYRITGRVDDVAGRPLALATYDGELAQGALEVPLVLFGKIARDEGATAPFVLRDVEGFRLLDGVYPDRETMATWSGPYRSRAYRAEELSAEPWRQGEPPAATPRAR